MGVGHSQSTFILLQRNIRASDSILIIWTLMKFLANIKHLYFSFKVTRLVMDCCYDYKAGFKDDYYYKC